MSTNQVENITIADIRNVVEVLDVCATRGAFRGPELESVGKLRTKLATFVQAKLPDDVDGDEPEDNEEGSYEEESETVGGEEVAKQANEGKGESKEGSE